MLSSFGMDFALKFGGEEQKNKKRSSSQNLSYLIMFTRSVLLFHRKKAFVATCFWAKVRWAITLAQKLFLAREGLAVIWGGTARIAPSPCIGSARIFEWGA